MASGAALAALLWLPGALVGDSLVIQAGRGRVGVGDVIHIGLERYVNPEKYREVGEEIPLSPQTCMHDLRAYSQHLHDITTVISYAIPGRRLNYTDESITSGFLLGPTHIHVRVEHVCDGDKTRVCHVMQGLKMRQEMSLSLVQQEE
eukprot:333239-Amorphochlora_amoeboformis.AAC.2